VTAHQAADQTLSDAYCFLRRRKFIAAVETCLSSYSVSPIAKLGSSVLSSPRTIGDEWRLPGECRGPRRRNKHRGEVEWGGASPADYGVWESGGASGGVRASGAILVVYKPAQNASLHSML